MQGIAQGLIEWLEATDEPYLEAVAARERWLHIHEVAAAAAAGRIIDRSLPQVTSAPAEYLEASREAVDLLSAWLEFQRIAAPAV